MPNYASQSDALIYISEFPDVVFQTLSGGGSTTANSTVNPGGRTRGSVTVNGPTTIDAITISKAYDVGADRSVIRFLKDWDRGRRAKVTVVRQPVNADGTANGEPDSFVRCSVNTWDNSAADSSSAEARMLTISFQPEDRD